MDIIYDARAIRPLANGIGTYAYNLLQSLLKADNSHIYHALFLRGNVPEELRDFPNLRVIETKADFRSHPRGEFWENLTLPRLAKELSAGIIFGPSFLIPWVKTRARKIVTVHDLTAFRYPSNYNFLFYRYIRLLIRMAVRTSQLIVVPSRFTRNELVDLLKADEKRIVVAPGASSLIYQPLSQAEREVNRKKLPIGDRFILNVANFEPRKNQLALIRAFAQLKKIYHIPQKLVLIGSGPFKKQAFRLVKEAKLSDEVIIFDYKPPEELALFYNCAELFVYPSYYEGFGLPVLEAMACGLPVICARSASLPEVAGEAALFFNPRDPIKLSQHIWRLINEKGLRHSLVEKGLKRVQQFSWDKTARIVLNAFQSVA